MSEQAHEQSPTADPAATVRVSAPPGGAEPTVAADHVRETVPWLGAADTDAETRVLLRRRLLVAFLIFVGVVAAANVVSALFDIGSSDWWDLLLLSVWGGLIALLASRRRLSLTALRACELVGFGIFATIWCWWTVAALDLGNLGPLLAVPGGGVAVAGTVSIMWFSLMTMYGVAIPNTRHRVVIVVGVMATSPFAIAAVMWWGSGPLETARVWLLFYLGFWMVFGAATAIYASHKITTLRREVAEARKLGPYKLVRKLGSGGMGEVYLAEHSLLKRPCAVKLIRPERAGDPQALRRFEREVQTTASLTHPSTIQVYDYGHTPDGTFYYAMEYIPGLPLDELVRRAGLLPTGRVVHVLLQLCGALAEAHAAKLVHRDIKPGNVILGERGGRADVAKLLDFGLVTAPTGGDDLQTREGTITGTPAYMSPEQAAGRGEVGPASDIYSLGAVAYFLLTGRTLFPDRSVVQVLGAHLYETPDPPGKHRPDLPADLEEVVVRCLAKKPADRFPDVGSLESALARCAVAGSWSQADAANWWRDQAERRG